MENENFIIDLVDSDGILPSSSPFKPDTAKQLISPRKHNSCNKPNDKLSSSFNKDSYRKYTDDLAKISTVLDRITSPNKIVLHQEEEMSPLEDFYSLKNAASDDEDARYFYSLFKNESHSATDLSQLDNGTEPVVTYSSYKRTLLESSNENHSNEYDNVDKKHCAKAKELFNSLGQEFEVMELDKCDKLNDYSDALKELTKRTTVPNIFINGKNIGGNDNLQELNANGQLRGLLGL